MKKIENLTLQCSLVNIWWDLKRNIFVYVKSASVENDILSKSKIVSTLVTVFNLF
jgi:hypothetical protein